MEHRASSRSGGHGWERSLTTLSAGTSSYDGTSGYDALYTGTAGSTIQVAAVEFLLGGTGTDIVTIGSGGATMWVGGIETLTGGAGTDLVFLGGFGNTLSVSGIETLRGSAGADVITVSSGTITVAGVGGGDSITLAAENGADTLVVDQAGKGFPGFGSTSTNYAQITNFQSGTDSLAIAGGLKRQVDHDDDGIVDSASRASGEIDLSTDEVVALTTQATSLTDTDFASVRSAIGTVSNGSAGNSTIVVVSDGAGSSGAYAVSDRNGDGQIASSEIRLLGLFNGTSSLSVTDVTFG